MTAPEASPAEGTVTVTETGTGTYTQQITAGRHQFVADEPRPIGDDEGADTVRPVTGCARGLHVDDGTDVRRTQGLAARSGSVVRCDTAGFTRRTVPTAKPNRWITDIDRDIELTGDLDDDQRQQLLHIAERCPVHQTLTSEVDVATSLR